MKRMIAIALALGAISPAVAQSDTGLFFEAPAVLSPAQPSITVHLWAEIPASDYLFAAARFDAHASEPGWSNPELVLRGPGQDPGTVVESDVVGVVVGQLSFPPAPPPSVNPVEIWRITFTITDFHPRTVSLSTETSLFYVYPDPSSGVGEPRASHEATHEIRVIPAPGALGLGGLGALAGTPRRRRP